MKRNATNSPSVNRSLLRRSGILKALNSACSMLEGIAGSPSRLDLLAGGRRETMCRDRERVAELAGAKHLDALLVTLEQPDRDQRGHVHGCASRELLKI